MKLFAVLFFIATNGYANVPSQSEVRAAFQQAAIKENSCNGLLRILQPYNENNSPVLGGYKACATMMMAKYVINPFTKLSYFLKGKSLLEKCIVADKQNIELRFLRYTIQTKAPFFLGYRASFKEDETIITKAVYHLKDPELKKMIVDFLKTEKVIK